MSAKIKTGSISAEDKLQAIYLELQEYREEIYEDPERIGLNEALKRLICSHRYHIEQKTMLEDYLNHLDKDFDDFEELARDEDDDLIIDVRQLFDIIEHQHFLQTTLWSVIIEHNLDEEVLNYMKAVSITNQEIKEEETNG